MIIASSPLVVSEDIEANGILSFMVGVKNFFFSRVFVIAFCISAVLISLYLYYDAKSKRYKNVGRVAFNKFS